jgi:hypothetical protein
MDELWLGSGVKKKRTICSVALLNALMALELSILRRHGKNLLGTIFQQKFVIFFCQ